MKSRCGSQASTGLARSFLRSMATVVLSLACLTVGLSATVALAAPAAPVITGPTSVQFSYYPEGFRIALTWDPVPTAIEYRVYHAETQYYVGSVTDPSCEIFGMQGFLYHHYVVAVDSTGATSSPSNYVDILTTAPVPPAPPAGFDVVPKTVFGVQTSTAPLGAVPVKVPYNRAYVVGDLTDLRLMHYTGSSWEDVTTSVDTTHSFVLGEASPSSVFAVMEPNGEVVCTITPSAGADGSITPDMPQTVAYGSDSGAFTITPDASYHVADVLVDGVSVGAVTSHTFANVSSDHTISATFAADPVTLATTTDLSGPSIVRVRQTLVLTGTISPESGPGTVTVVKSRLVGGDWISAGSSRVAVLDGSFTYDFTPTKRGSWRVVATYSGGLVGSVTYAPSTSDSKILTVK